MIVVQTMPTLMTILINAESTFVCAKVDAAP